MRQQPDLTLAELQQRIQLWIWLQRLGLRHKKIAPRARARNRREPLAAADEVGTDKRGRSRLFGVSRRKRCDHGDDPPLWLGASPGTRLEAIPAGHWRILTVLAALTTQGVLASMTIESQTMAMFSSPS